MLYVLFAGLLPCIGLLARAWLQERAARRREREAHIRRDSARAAVRAAVTEFHKRMDVHEAEARRLGIIP